MSEYRHGAYGDIESTRDYSSPPGVGTIPVYFGRSPIHQLAQYTGKTNVPILVSSYNDGVRQLGYSDDWENYELSEALYAHFKNNVQSVGPIIVVNAFDPDENRKTSETLKTVQFLKRKATLASAKVILSTLKIAEKVRGTDYTAVYAADGLSVLLQDLTGGMDEVEVSYFEADPTAVTDTDIVATIKAALPEVYYAYNEVPTLLCAPGWSAKKTVYEALVSESEKVNDHWYCYINADLDCSMAKTVQAAIAAKEAYDLLPGKASLLWPMGKRGNRKYRLSTLNTVTMQWVDLQNGNIPYETPSNKRIDIDSLCLADDTPIRYDQKTANTLNAKGINTAIFWEGSWRMWGSHTAAFEHDQEMDKRDVFDCNVRMVYYVANLFQRRYGIEVDKPMRRARKDTIVNDFQAVLDAMINDGALLAGSITFEETQNQIDDMVLGNFIFATEVSNPIPGKNLTTSVRWTSEGLTTMFGGETE